MQVSRYDYPAQFADLDATVDQIRRMLVNGSYILDETVQRFENRFARYVGTRHAVGVNSGTDALILALRALDIGPGDEVITVANTFYASALAITAVGAVPRLVDCRPDDHLMDLEQVHAAIGPRTRAVLAVHLFGKALPMAALRALTDRHCLALIEDCAQAVGARSGTSRVGSFGHAGCFSFHPSKNLAAAGDAGAVVTSDDNLADRIRTLRNLGQQGQNNHVLRGVNSKLDALQALVLDHKLEHLDRWNEQRRTVAADYAARLAAPPVRVTPAPDPEHVYHLYQVTVPARDAVLTELCRRGVDAVVRYPVPIHRQPAFADLGLGGDFPHAEHQARTTLCLPIRPNLSRPERDHVVDSLRAALTLQDVAAGR
ncbi:MAG TPA: DegT/DnrJ/EryC1/StrS family aminotransferase [Pilimelia sp.]|nr:DegT/DnrJ/EryC1/StrS family aminotransferase [Pilimelia sp.]